MQSNLGNSSRKLQTSIHVGLPDFVRHCALCLERVKSQSHLEVSLLGKIPSLTPLFSKPFKTNVHPLHISSFGSLCGGSGDTVWIFWISVEMSEVSSDPLHCISREGPEFLKLGFPASGVMSWARLCLPCLLRSLGNVKA